MSSPAERIECREVLYCGQSASIPGLLLCTAGELAFVQFETKHWAGYEGFSIYVTTAIFPEHLKFCEQRPQAVVNLFQAPVLEVASQHQENGQGAPSPRIVKPPPAAKLPAKQREPSKSKLNGKKVHDVVKFPTRSLARARTIGGLSLRDFGTR
jgi:hypothetical protein